MKNNFFFLSVAKIMLGLIWVSGIKQLWPQTKSAKIDKKEKKT